MLRNTPPIAFINPKIYSLEFVLRILQMICMMVSMATNKDSFFAVYIVCLLQMTKGIVFENYVDLLAPEKLIRVLVNYLIGIISFTLSIKYFE